MEEFQAFAATRVRGDQANTDRMTGNVVAALFTHDTSRALDCHLHTHCILFNATFDPKEERWKALQNHHLLRARKYAESVYYHELAGTLRACGYDITRRSRGDFEIMGVSESLCGRFSKRHNQIDAALERLIGEKPELAGVNLKDLRERLAVAERSRKMPTASRDELLGLWEAQTSLKEQEDLARVVQSAVRHPDPVPSSSAHGLREAIEWAEEHLFDRHSVVPEFQIWQTALQRVCGSGIGIQDLKTATRRRGYLRGEEGMVTLRSVRDREQQIIQLAAEGVDRCTPLIRFLPRLNPKMDAEQKRALEGLARSRNRVSLFRGGAGTGKSFVLRGLVEVLTGSVTQVVVLAPQRQQVVDLEQAGFPRPNTVSGFLQGGNLERGSVLLIDEAGQIGGRQMLDLLGRVKAAGCRLILSGDTRQHGPVAACDALVAIERHSGIPPVELHSIRRQDPSRAHSVDERARIRAYRSAVAAAASGKNAESFKRLNAMGAVVECSLADQAGMLADDYVKHRKTGDSVLVVSQTWAEVQRVNGEVRARLKRAGILGAEETRLVALEKLDHTSAQKRDPSSYAPEAVIVFNQKLRGLPQGTRGRFVAAVRCGILVEAGGRIVTVEKRHLEKLTVCRPFEIAVSPGERLLLKSNRRLKGGRRATNGEVVTVHNVDADGSIRLRDGRILDSTYREFLPGYAVTSYSAQGKTVDYVLFSDSTIKAATNSQQWYVTISRGRRGIRIFTPDKFQLRECIEHTGHRALATDLVDRDQSNRNEFSPGLAGGLGNEASRPHTSEGAAVIPLR
jgi:ATP-dependent exoDNAse (exonuclease V) alpha subunit